MNPVDHSWNTLVKASEGLLVTCLAGGVILALAVIASLI